jgi:hypothetical protein
MVARISLAVLGVAIYASVTATSTHAQSFGGGFYQGRSDNPNGPTVSPYLNLLQNNNQLNGQPTYQSLVKPLVDQQAAIQRQGNSLQQLQQQVRTQSSGAPSQRATGHTTFFMNYSHYYPNATRPQQR